MSSWPRALSRLRRRVDVKRVSTASLSTRADVAGQPTHATHPHLIRSRDELVSRADEMRMRRVRRLSGDVGSRGERGGGDAFDIDASAEARQRARPRGHGEASCEGESSDERANNPRLRKLC